MEKEYSTGLGVSAETLVVDLRDKLNKYSRDEIVRELLQNADDAGATRLYFFLLRKGEAKACHPLLELPGLLVFNDGPLKETDVKSINKLIGGGKAQDEAKVGRFGLGLKSIFHICDALFYDAFVPGSSSHGIMGHLLDPMYEARKDSKYKSRMQQWENSQTKEAIYKINKCLTDILPESIKTGFFMLAPGRKSDDGLLHIKNDDFSYETFEQALIDSLDEIIPAFAQCAKLQEIQAFAAPSLTALRNKKRLVSIKRDKILSGKCDNTALGRPVSQDKSYKRNFAFKINFENKNYNSTWTVGGIELFDPDNEALKAIKDKAEWPKTGLDESPEKGLPHVAITLLSSPKSKNGLNWRWASFYPLAVNLEQASKTLVCHGGRLDAIDQAVELLLHGYFFVSSDRKNIHAITNKYDGDIKSQWNASIKKELLLPLLPEALFAQFETGIISASQLGGICKWCANLDEKNLIIAQKVLVKNVLTEKWELLDKNNAFFELPPSHSKIVKKWAQAKNENFVCKNEGLYASENVKKWPGDLLFSLMTELSADRNLFDANDLEYIQKIVDAAAYEYQDEIRDWFIHMLANGYFATEGSFQKNGLRYKLINFAYEYIYKIIINAPQETEKALRRIADNQPDLLKPKLILPINPRDMENIQVGNYEAILYLANMRLGSAKNETPDFSSEQQRTGLFGYLGRKLEDRDKQKAEEIRLAEYLRPENLSLELDKLNLIRVAVFSGGERLFGERDLAVSKKDIDKKWEAGLLFVRDNANTVSDDLLKSLSSAMKTGCEIWRPTKNPENSCIANDCAGIDQLYRIITQNGHNLSSDNKSRLSLYNKLSSEGDTSNLGLKYKALRFLIAGESVADDIHFIIESEGCSLVSKFGKDFIFISEEWTKKLTGQQKKSIKIYEDLEARESIVLKYLRGGEPWKHFEEIRQLLPYPKRIGDELVDVFSESCWVPDAKKENGYKIANILPDQPFCGYLESSLPRTWILKKDIKQDGWLENIFSQLEKPDFNSQIKNLLKDEEFKSPNYYFPSNFEADEWESLPEFARYIKQDEKANTLLLHALKLDKGYLHKFANPEFEYNTILEAAHQYHKNNLSNDLDEFLIDYLKAVIDLNHDIFTTTAKFPTRKKGVWKSGNEILDDTINAGDDGLLPEELWLTHKKYSKNYKENNNTDQKAIPIEDQVPVLEQFFNSPYCVQESRRIACFCVLLAGAHAYSENFRKFALDWFKKGQSSIIQDNNFIKQMRESISTDELAWQHVFTISHVKKDHENIQRALSGKPYISSENKRTFFTVNNDIDNNDKENKRKDGPESRSFKICANKEWKCQARDHDEFCILLRNSMELLAKIRDIEPTKINNIWEENASAQAPIDETNRLIKEDLRLVGKILKLKDPEIKTLISRLDSEISRKKEQNSAQIKNDLYNTAKKCPEVLLGIQKFIKDQGYRINGTLLELIQNADDALHQIENPRNFTVKITLGNQNLEFSHYGRLINSGDKQEFKRDLYNMLQFNGSEKDGTSTTGKYGLGFKSVYLLTEESFIQSGGLCFNIRNGIFPENSAKRMPEIEDDYDITKFVFKLNRDITEDELFERLDPAAFLIPVFSKKIDKLIIIKNGFKKKYSFAKPSASEKNGYALDQENGLLHFYARESGTSITIQIDKSGLPQKMPEKTPPLWVTLPLNEGQDWELGYAINGNFIVDTGRLNITDDKENYELLKKLGESLGRSLTQWGKQIQQEKPGCYQSYYYRMWQILSSGFYGWDVLPEKKKKILSSLHANGRGLSHWLASGNALGHGIPEPWSRPLANSSLQIWMHDICDDENFMEFVKNLENMKLADKVGSCGIVSSKNGAILRELGIKVCDADEKQIFTRLFKALLPDDKHLQPEIFRPCLKLYDLLPQYSDFEFKVETRAGTWAEIKNVLLPPDLKERQGYSDYKDELVLASFAPDEKILSNKYIKTTDEAKLFVRLRGSRKSENNETIAAWIANATGKQRISALEYLSEGNYSNRPWDELKENFPDSWILNRKEVLEICKSNGIDSRIIEAIILKDCSSISKENDESYEEPEKNIEIQTEHSNLKEIIEYWECNKEIILQIYIKTTYPYQFWDQNELREKLNKDDPEAWQMLLLLGCLQSIGRMPERASQNFAQNFYEKNQRIFKEPLLGLDRNWLEIICNWQNSNIEENSRSLFMEKTLYFHQTSRYLQNYIYIIKKAPEVDANALQAFSPRSFSGFSGGGDFFDVPPLPLKIGRHWVLRELSRLGVSGFRPKNDEFLKLCWVPKKACLKALGIEYGQDPAENHSKLINTLTQQNNGELPTFDYCFDIAILFYGGN